MGFNSAFKRLRLSNLCTVLKFLLFYSCMILVYLTHYPVYVPISIYFFSVYLVVYIVSLCLKFFTKYYKFNVKFLIALYILSYAVNHFFNFINCVKFILLTYIKFKGFYSMERHQSVEIKISTLTLLQIKDNFKLYLLFAAFSSYFKSKSMTSIAEFKGSY